MRDLIDHRPYILEQKKGPSKNMFRCLGVFFVGCLFAETLGPPQAPKAPQAGLFVFYDLVWRDATWTWPAMPEGRGGSNNPRYPREELFVGSRYTLDPRNGSQAARGIKYVRALQKFRNSTSSSFTDPCGPTALRSYGLTAVRPYGLTAPRK